jgi:glycogen debranching enzyme
MPLEPLETQVESAGLLPGITSEVLQDYQQASSREWLVTNGIGGYASSSLAGSNTRRYHGLLVAALTPPTGRQVLLSKMEEAVFSNGQTYELSANQYPGVIHPQGFQYLERFEVYPAPTFTFRLGPALLLQKRIWMAYGRNTTYIQYTLLEAPGPIELTLLPLICGKGYHEEMSSGCGPLPVSRAASHCTEIQCLSTPAQLRLLLPGSEWEATGCWFYNFEHAREQERGLDWREDLYNPGRFHIQLRPGETITLTATTEEAPEEPAVFWSSHIARQNHLLSQANAQDDFSRALVLASDAFVVEGQGARRRGLATSLERTTVFDSRLSTLDSSLAPRALPLAPSASRSTIIAGYHWFTDWGRDTMIALPGLCLLTGRAEVAKDILLSFAGYVSQGMIPNRFPDKGEEPEYNTVDATLWFIRAVRQVAEHAGDGFALARELWPVLTEIIDWHVKGTRYNIHVDPEDGLLWAGQAAVQLTWMDAKVGDWVVTPRIGKPVEINALWHDALMNMAGMGREIGEPVETYETLAQKARQSFQEKFIRPDGQGLYDVLTDGLPDASIRPNQVFAVSLCDTLLPEVVQKSILKVLEGKLLTPYGLRTLPKDDPGYRGNYFGDQWQRDGAYHQGTVWPWLLGPFVEAHYRLYKNAELAKAFLLPLQGHLLEAGVGSISEIFDGDPPYAPDGCIAQAWSVAEVLRVWQMINKS